MSFDIDTTPLDRAAADLGRVADHLEDTGPLLKDAASEVARTARPPRRTGRLAASVRVSTDQDSGVARWGVGYAVYVNFGTRRMPARPFASDALAASEATIEGLAHRWATDTLGRL